MDDVHKKAVAKEVREKLNTVTSDLEAKQFRLFLIKRELVWPLEQEIKRLEEERGALMREAEELCEEMCAT